MRIISPNILTVVLLLVLASIEGAEEVVITVTPYEPYYNDFEKEKDFRSSSDSKWIFGPPSTPLYLASAYSGINCWSSGNSDGYGTERDDNKGTLTSKFFNIEKLSKPFVAYRMWAMMEPHNRRPAGAVVLKVAQVKNSSLQLSDEKGLDALDWKIVMNAKDNSFTNWYRKLPQSTSGSEYGWDYSTDNMWIVAFNPIEEKLTGTIVFRFFNHFGGYNGFAIDDFVIGDLEGGGSPACIKDFSYQIQPALGVVQVFWEVPSGWVGKPSSYSSQLANVTDGSTISEEKREGLNGIDSFPLTLLEKNEYSYRINVFPTGDSAKCEPLKFRESNNDILYSENFEHGKGGWNTKSLSIARSSVPSWKLMDIPHALEGHSGWKTNSIFKKYDNAEFSAVVSPLFNFTSLKLDADPIVAVQLSVELIETDRFLLQIAFVEDEYPAKEKDWKIVGDVHGPQGHDHGVAINWYNIKVLNITSTEEAAKEMDVGWGGKIKSGGWFVAKHTLNDSKDKAFYLRFVLIAEHPDDTGEGIGFDDIVISPPTPAEMGATNYAVDGTRTVDLPVSTLTSTSTSTSTTEATTSATVATNPTVSETTSTKETVDSTTSTTSVQPPGSTNPVTPNTSTKPWNPTKVILSISGVILLTAATIFLVKWMRGNDQNYQSVLNVEVELETKDENIDSKSA